VEIHKHWYEEKLAGLTRWYMMRLIDCEIYVYQIASSRKWHCWVLGRGEKEICELRARMVLQLSHEEVEAMVANSEWGG